MNPVGRCRKSPNYPVYRLRFMIYAGLLSRWPRVSIYPLMHSNDTLARELWKLRAPLARPIVTPWGPFTHIHAIDPKTQEMAPLYHPSQDQWEVHFQWIKDFRFLVGISPTGRATIERLRLNRIGTVNLRRVLHADGSHPPR